MTIVKAVKHISGRFINTVTYCTCGCREFAAMGNPTSEGKARVVHRAPDMLRGRPRN